MTRTFGGPVICHRISGIGDQILQLAHGILLGRANRVAVYADWRRSLFTGDHQRMLNLFGNVVRHPDARPIEDLQRTELPDGIRQCVHDARYGSTLSEQNFLEFIRSGFTCRWTIFEGPLNVHRLRPELEPILANFAWSSDVVSRADAVLSTATPGQVIAIHYRHGNGEFASAKTDEAIEAEMDAMMATARLIARSMTAPRALLATDSIAAETYFRIKLGLPLLTQPKSYLPPSSGALHYAGPPGHDRFGTLLESLADIELMARCDALVRDEKSTFSLVSGARIRQRLGDKGVITEVPTRRIKARFLASYAALSQAVAERQE